MSIIEPIANVRAETLAGFDAIIDVRSPAEYEEDHLPGAVNLPVLSNAERAEVGTIYKQVSKTRARRIGAALVARNIAGHLETWFGDKPEEFHPLIYCWRGGMRSHAMATVLSQVCWHTGVLDGGYKTWRRKVVAELHDSEAPFNVVLIDGETGAGKSDIIRALIGAGAQVIDLEDLAAHRGSVFGAYPGATQPSQKLFETQLWQALETIDPAQPVFIEAESNRIGRCEIPKRLWLSMLAARRVTVNATPERRAAYLVNAYADFVEDKARVLESLNALRRFQSKEQLESWMEMAEAEDYETLAASLMRHHYDPLYQRSRKRRTDKPLLHLDLDRLDEEAFAVAAARIIECF